MNKTSKFFMGFASLAMLAACSDDAPVNDGGNVIPGDGTTAYMSVMLSAPGDFGRSTDFENGDEVDGALVPGTEHDITSAKFFFFDENGNFALNAKLTSPDFGDSSQMPNIEWESKSNILVLEDLKSNTFPRYMLTVLNMPDFEAETTLQATAEKLTAESYQADGYIASVGADKVSNFVMTTSSYRRSSNLGSDLTVDSRYAVNELQPSDFKVTPSDAMNSANAVVVYVERLAAKVEVDVNVTVAANKKTYEKDGVNHTIYKLNQTVAGDENDNNTGGSTNPTADADLYVEILGWSLNATANQSHMSKQLQTAWFTTQPFAAWENATKFRSYWAYSYPYTLGTGCESVLNYVKYTDINADALHPGLGADHPQYCYENTNAPANILKLNTATNKYDVYNSRVTHVVLNTRLCDSEGNDVSALNFRGTLFTESHLKNYALNALKNANELNYWVSKNGVVDPDVNQPAEFQQVGVDAIGFEGMDGTMAQAVFKYTGTAKLYKRTETGGVVKFEAYDDASELETALNALASSLPIEWYNTRNIYYIPVEHNAMRSATTNNVEGYYGVVRNHWYKIEINSFSKVGHGIYDPDDETITVKPEEPEDTYYYLGAHINVLSWRVIKQNVDL